MSMEMDAVIESCVRTIQSDPQHTREEIALMLNRWEDVGLISRQMRAVIVQRLRESQQKATVRKQPGRCSPNDQETRKE
jgi:hypothetical protein